jgi:plasmid stabilization system protein ParE
MSKGAKLKEKAWRFAQADFDAIVDYLVYVAGRRLAVAYAERLQASLNLLADYRHGRPREQFGSETRMVSVNPYLIFYDGAPGAPAAHVLRILDGRCNIAPTLIARGSEQ